MWTRRQEKVRLTIIFGTLATCAFFSAQAATTVLATYIVQPAAAQPSTLSRAPRSPATQSVVDTDAILRRNIFDSETGDLTRADAPPLAEERLPSPELGAAVACTGTSRLLGSMVVPHHQSYALIRGGDGQTQLFREGMLFEDQEVTKITSSGVHMMKDGQVCALSMFAAKEEQAPVSRNADRSTTTNSESATETTPPALAGIQKTGENHFRVERSTLRGLLAGPGTMSLARVKPHQDGDRTTGLDLLGIRKGSPLASLGMQNGDILRTVNGYEVSRPEVALTAYSELQSASSITVNLVRKGRPLSLEFAIQE